MKEKTEKVEKAKKPTINYKYIERLIKAKEIDKLKLYLDKEIKKRMNIVGNMAWIKEELEDMILMDMSIIINLEKKEVLTEQEIELLNKTKLNLKKDKKFKQQVSTAHTQMMNQWGKLDGLRSRIS